MSEITDPSDFMIRSLGVWFWAPVVGVVLLHLTVLVDGDVHHEGTVVVVLPGDSDGLPQILVGIVGAPVGPGDGVPVRLRGVAMDTLGR